MPPEIVYYISKYGYLAILVLVFLQETGVPNPIPNELVLMFSGYLSFKGVLLFPVIILTAIAADFVGTSILYVVFFFSGSFIIKHLPRWFPVSKKVLDNMRVRLSGKGKWKIFLGRITPFIRGYTSVTAGLLHIKPKIFFPIAVGSAILWSSVCVLTGRLLGGYWSLVDKNINNIKYGILAVVLTVIAILVLRYLKRRKPEKL